MCRKSDIIPSRHCFQRAVSLNFCGGVGLIRNPYSCVDSCRMYAVNFSPTVSGSSEIQRFERSEIGIIFNFDMGLPLIRIVHQCFPQVKK